MTQTTTNNQNPYARERSGSVARRRRSSSLRARDHVTNFTPNRVDMYLQTLLPRQGIGKTSVKKTNARDAPSAREAVDALRGGCRPRQRAAYRLRPRRPHA